MIEATLYIRFSSDEQESGDSVRRQKDLGHEYAEKNGLKIIEEVVDSGVSAFRGLNFTEGNLGKWLKKAETGNAPKKLLVENLDRITRLPARKAYNKITSILGSKDRVWNQIEILNEFEQEMLKHVHEIKKDLREKGWWERETPEVYQTSFLRSEEMECSMDT